VPGFYRELARRVKSGHKKSLNGVERVFSFGASPRG